MPCALCNINTKPGLLIRVDEESGQRIRKQQTKPGPTRHAGAEQVNGVHAEVLRKTVDITEVESGPRTIAWQQHHRRRVGRPGRDRVHKVLPTLAHSHILYVKLCPAENHNNVHGCRLVADPLACSAATTCSARAMFLMSGCAQLCVEHKQTASDLLACTGGTHRKCIVYAQMKDVGKLYPCYMPHTPTLTGMM